MNSRKRPVSVLVIAWLYIVIGAVGFIAHFRDLRHPDGIGIEVSELIALVAGLFLLGGHSWARWLALAWMAFHVVISYPEISRIAIHAVFLAAIAWLLFRSDARAWFRNAS
jgi:hypothetical protein